MGDQDVNRFWTAFNHYDHGRRWCGDTVDEEEESDSVLLEWDLRGPAHFAAVRERALRLGGSRLAAKSATPYGEAGVHGRAAYALQLLAALHGLAEQVEIAARERRWDLAVGVLIYREPREEESDNDEEAAATEDELITDMDPEELAACDSLVFWIEADLPDDEAAVWKLGEGLGRLISAAATWFERLDAGDREAIRTLPRLAR